jgi:hypothetical protein
MKGLVRNLGLTSTLAVLLAIAAAVCTWDGVAGTRTEYEADRPPYQVIPPQKDPGSKEFPVPVRPLPLTIMPCRSCHGPEKDFRINWSRSEILRVHTGIELNHGGMKVWCLDCHHPSERNYLVPLADGQLILFSESYMLCGKCHGTKFRDWRHGVHGKREGSWSAEKTYYLCVHCHDPHSPRYKSLEPLPPPSKPRTPKEKVAAH